MNAITTRKATHDDLPVLLQFEQAIIRAERPFDETLQHDPISYYDLAAMINTSHVEVIVAESGNTIIGSGFARIEKVKPYLKHQQHAWLGFMYVDPAYRGQGVNKMIIDALKQWTAAKGLTELRLDVYHDNLPAIKAYEKVGFTRLLIEMRIGI